MTETIGQRLKHARVYRHLTLEKAASVTRIRLQYLQALEADDFSAMPSPVQARGFLRNYADYLGLDLEQMVAELRSTAPQPDPEQEIVFEGDASQLKAPETIEEPGQFLAPQEPPTLEEGDKPAPFPKFRGWLKSLPFPRKAPDGESGVQQSVEEAPTDTGAGSPTGSKSAALLPGEAALDAEPQAAQEPVIKNLTAFVWMVVLGWLRGRLARQAPPAESEDESREIDEPAAPEAQPEHRNEIQAEETAQQIFDAVGSQLRRRRDILSLTLAEIERHTHMRAQFLAALEEGRMDELPSPVQTRGMLSNYATFLDLDADALLLRFADALQAQHRERYPDKPTGRREQVKIPQKLPPLRMFIAGDLVLGTGMIILLLVFLAWGISRVFEIRSQAVTVEETAPSISEALIGTPEVIVEIEATPIPAEDTPLPAVEEALEPIDDVEETPTLLGNINLKVDVVAVERSYLRVVVDGNVKFDGRTVPGTAYPFEAEQSIEILAGNASALRIIYNQRDLGLLGGFGQLAHFVYTADGIIVPTPVSSLTPTLTPFISPTPSITPSPTETSTAEDELP